MTETVRFCSKCGTTKPLSEFYKNRARHDGISVYCGPCHCESTVRNAQKQRMEVIDLLGGPVCVRCGFDDVRALVIDHINGGGNQHRKDTVSVWGVYRHALAHPDEYQILCWNCNHIKRHENGEWGSKEYVAKVRANPREILTRPPRWARDFDSCQGCETTEEKHKSKGLCVNCYMRLYRRGTTEKVEDLSALRSENMKARWADPEGRRMILESHGLGLS